MACSRVYIDALDESLQVADGDGEYSTESYLHEITPLISETGDYYESSSSDDSELDMADESSETNSSSSDSNDPEGDEMLDVGDISNVGLSHIFPVFGNFDSMLVVSAALLVLVVEKNISKVALNCIMNTLMITGFVQARFTWTSICRILKRKLIPDSIAVYTFHNNEGAEFIYFDMKRQVELIMYRYLETMKNYREVLLEGNGDIICSSQYLNSTDPFYIHLHISTDGGQMYNYKRSNLWPIHATLLDLPLSIRSRPENLLLMVLWEGKKKPEWSSIFSNYLSGSCLNEPMVLCIGAVKLNVIIKLHTAVFDLPAMASVLNHTQFNGEFGCIYCRSPGVSLPTRRGHSRKYGGIETVITDQDYLTYVELALSTRQTVFGIKGKSCLTGHVQIPSHILLDPLHLLFENCSKLMISQLINSSSYRKSYYLGRHVDSYENLFKHFQLPSMVSKPRSLNDLSF